MASRPGPTPIQVHCTPTSSSMRLQHRVDKDVNLSQHQLQDTSQQRVLPQQHDVNLCAA